DVAGFDVDPGKGVREVLAAPATDLLVVGDNHHRLKAEADALVDVDVVPERIDGADRPHARIDTRLVGNGVLLQVDAGGLVLLRRGDDVLAAFEITVVAQHVA